MSEGTPQSQAVEELQQFGLREYEAKCFVSLTKIQTGTAREVSENIDIPRTRVYEAVRSLESNGLVEIQHSSPQRFRAIPIEEAAEILSKRYQKRIQAIEHSLRELRQTNVDQQPDEDSEVWSISGDETIATRTRRLISEAETEVLLLVGDDRVLSNELCQKLTAATDRGIDVVVGAGSKSLQEQLAGNLPSQTVFESELTWLQPDNTANIAIARLLLVDGKRVVASTIRQTGRTSREQAVCGSGAANGFVLVFRELLTQQLYTSSDPQ